MKIGSQYLGNGQCLFRVWAPHRKQVSVHLVYPEDRFIPLSSDQRGYWSGTASNITPGSLYFYQLDGDLERPDPASVLQPEGVHQASEVVDRDRFVWQDRDWQGLDLMRYIIYELHVGTFTEEGTFDGIIQRLPDLLELGINAIEIMPIAAFPGTRNWGYDGVYLYGVQASYGGPDGLKRLVNACHQAGIAVILDVVYNHFGPEGNYLWDYGPYFTGKYRTPWGDAVNYDDAYSDEVRNFFQQNALYWLEEYHIDALRLDAVHAIYDFSARPFLQQISIAVEELDEKLGYPHYLIAESDLNDARVLQPRDRGGFGHHSQWCDDFHHALHTALTGETSGYYQDFGQIEQLVKSYQQGYVYSGDYSPHRQRSHGNSPEGLSGENFVVCIQNHDQVGNRLGGDRMSALVDFPRLKLAAAALLLAPFIPMLFMGEEYGETAPFQYFISHGDRDLVEAVRQGRAKEFQSFGWDKEIPDPHSEKVFQESTLNWELARDGEGKILRSLYQTLIQLRRTHPALSSLARENLTVINPPDTRAIILHRHVRQSHLYGFMNFKADPVTLETTIIDGSGIRILDSDETQWLGSGATNPDRIDKKSQIQLSPWGFVLYSQE
ncbi:malto-oligosyltrehalose trehalohydrolase [Roseofilum casamattae]|uniref:Malto-oligosyltrehalose trehalohydrolase n=1 Tax=Roseofilum casamattae BLCC-M143 TaxID=3022442 RepID=A0ABT7BXA9_9CYAN|nr:malto-oligosyltrehalose trehalohydrolase [Roseofilum casamattae]MDJ1183806.1 malto-oligosyltrehalose trehalohydrolase [Roseofilum casamattae BLCC-M143]